MRTFQLPENSLLSLEVLKEKLAYLNCEVTLETTLRSLPDSFHWHIKKASEKRGVLEFTFDPRTGQRWLSVQSGREADWIDEVIAELGGRQE